MSDDQFQRQVDFIVGQQAKFEIAIGKIEETLAENAKQIKENTVNIAKLGDIILSLAHYNQGQDERIAAHDRQIAALIEAGKETDERMNILIKVVERFYNRNGNE